MYVVGRMAQRLSLGLVVAVAAAAISGCGGGITQVQFDKLKVGMTRTDVEAIIGTGGKEIGAEEITTLVREALTPKGAEGKAAKIELPDLTSAIGVRWGNDKKSVTVIFLGERALRIFKKGF